MTELRYLGSEYWTRTVLDDKGKAQDIERIPPHGTFSADGDVATRLLQGPRYNRLFVEVGSDEDPDSSGYQEKRSIGTGERTIDETSSPAPQAGRREPRPSAKSGSSS